MEFELGIAGAGTDISKGTAGCGGKSSSGSGALRRADGGSAIEVADDGD